MSNLDELDGSRWAGRAELWLDPLGDDCTTSDCTLAISGSVVRYTWSHDGKAHTGSITFDGDTATFTDSWHQPEPMACGRIAGTRSLFQIEGAYGPEADWGWRIGLNLRAPTGQLILQMTNIAPWGEEARAVRMTGDPA